MISQVQPWEDVQERWAAYPREDLYAWVKNSQVLIKAGHQELLNCGPSLNHSDECISGHDTG
jgi:hypothetical protein